MPLPAISHPTERPNFASVYDGFGNTLWFSYNTLVAFQAPSSGVVVRQNMWGPTTGKHLNWIDNGYKEIRVDSDTFEKLYEEHIGRKRLIISEAML